MTSHLTRPHIILVPGFWEGPSVFSALASNLTSHSYNCHMAPLASTGHPASATSPSMKDDVRAIRSVVERVVEQYGGTEVVMVLHSAGGFLGSMAIEGLSVEERKAAGREKGGVRRLVFVAGAVWEEGFRHGPLPFFEYRGPELRCASPETLLFNGIPPAIAAPHMANLSCQPASGWDDVVTYAAWKKIPSTYLVCEADAVLPPAMQREMAARAGSKVVESCKAGHMAIVGMPERVAACVRRAAGEKVG